MTDKKIKDLQKELKRLQNFIQQIGKRFFKWLPIETVPPLLDTLKRK